MEPALCREDSAPHVRFSRALLVFPGRTAGDDIFQSPCRPSNVHPLTAGASHNSVICVPVSSHVTSWDALGMGQGGAFAELPVPEGGRREPEIRRGRSSLGRRRGRCCLAKWVRTGQLGWTLLLSRRAAPRHLEETRACAPRGRAPRGCTQRGHSPRGCRWRGCTPRGRAPRGLPPR